MESFMTYFFIVCGIIIVGVPLLELFGWMSLWHSMHKLEKEQRKLLDGLIQLKHATNKLNDITNDTMNKLNDFTDTLNDVSDEAGKRCEDFYDRS